MQIILLIVVIVVLIVVHELGHFVMAKLTGMRVDEFGIGYPPRALLLGKVGETEYTLNWIPFGGFVRIYGEDAGAAGLGLRAFSSKNNLQKALVLVAGITMNLVLAYALITASLVLGTPRALDASDVARAHDTALVVVGVLPGSPAATAGLLPGDAITSAVTAAGAWQAVDPKSFTDFVRAGGGTPIKLSLKRSGGEASVTATPLEGAIADDAARYALGIQVATVGIVPLSIGAALGEGARITGEATRLTAVGLVNFLYRMLTFSADLSGVSGPVGIAGVVGSAATQGLGSLLSIMAIISINLALINLIPIPALDGGRLLFVIIEGVTRRAIPPRGAQAFNGIGFAFLVLLMVVVTAHDIFKLVG
ncbi:hypothetical protein COU19_02010 [Candidatus Kaiserbacteria bacterium CG10_big_fil_rev_8_21_14_0_10_56_12]|uniref:Peptidase M50 domain-containing protein n=1 Tax=Candidatus Kaiserbacteria bacterium CG10_big_fil_rev_8_21_14_0_10_56_12 TaxID=1974611 RepID=A0A2H0U9T5_9BACT|nr:MAG: hypothetical protein COU19_02010 [Candidatus Kaiserbacteria bacterium CG10_big_fil_rev_8_21_14_0_10_56_12]